jgi:CRP-like cAMP-binding protein
MPLEKSYLFQGLGEQAMAEIARIAVRDSYEKGAFLFRAGDAATHLYILEEGRIRLSVRGTGHFAQIVSEPGDALGWSSMVDRESYTASAECLVPVKVLKLDRDRLERVLEADPAGGLSFYKRLAWLIGQRLTASYGGTLSVYGERASKSYG